jgi:hypothetical protein
VDADTMLDWKTLITDANEAHHNHCYDDAIELNRHALLLSKENFDAIFISNDPEKAVALVLISYLNMIDSHIAQSRFTSAQLSFENIFDFLVNINKRPNKADLQQVAIINAVQKLYIEWALFLKKHSKSLTGPNEVWLKKLPTFISVLSNQSTQFH